MHLQIVSSNPALSWIISKNPNGTPYVAPLRGGVGFGWFSNPTTYNLFLRGGQYDQIDGHNNPSIAPTAALGLLGFVSDALKGHVKDVVRPHQDKHKVYFSALQVRDKTWALFEAYYPTTVFNQDELSITHYGTVQDFLAIVMSFLLIGAMQDKWYVPANKDAVVKYANTLVIANTPYFIRYVFKVWFRDHFAAIKPILDTDTINLTYGDTHDARIAWAKEHIVGGDILDFGCGEGRYIKHLIGRSRTYTAIDIDPDIIEDVAYNYRRLVDEGKLECDTDLAWDTTDQYDFILCTEVLEHNPYDDALHLLAKLITLGKTILVTVPDRSFNQYYATTGYRHEDHHWEPTYIEFYVFINQALELAGDQYATTTYYQIGDNVDGTTPTLGVIISKE